MAINTSVTLDQHFTDFIERQIAGGRYRSASETIRAGLRLLEEQELRYEILRREIAAGEASGEPQAFSLDEFLAEKSK